MIDCPDCGNDLPDVARYCPDCGTPVGTGADGTEAGAGGDADPDPPTVLGIDPGSRTDAAATLAVAAVAGGAVGVVLSIAGLLATVSFAGLLPGLGVGIATGVAVARLGTVREALVRGPAAVGLAAVLAPACVFGPGFTGGDAAGRVVLFALGEGVALGVAVPLGAVAGLAWRRRPATDGGATAAARTVPGAVDDCPDCGGGLPATARYCAHCGIDLIGEGTAGRPGDPGGATGDDGVVGLLGADPDGRGGRVATLLAAGAAGVVVGVVGTAAGVVATADGWSLLPGPVAAVVAAAVAGRQPTPRRAVAVGADAVAVAVLLAPLALWGPAGETQPGAAVFLAIEAGAGVVAGAVTLVGRAIGRDGR